ncbi:MAG: cytochrome c biogenesis protein CcdA [Nitrospirae bacterium]|nr:cytochrome c biogenesis protein CcdA [Nitrospirota bacterium]MBI3594201.1 cytochrome c biogenesis protein CcdA [Nitrospirota bacterium]
MTSTVSYFMAFTAGLFSFISPCVLPVVPSYLCYITGLSFDDLTDESESPEIIKWMIIKNSLMFIGGFSFVFILFGATATTLGQFLHTYQGIIRKISGIIVIFFGFYIMGILKLAFLMSDRRIHLQDKPAGLAGSFIVGVAFASGWTPCVGPILGTILLYASTSDSVWNGVFLLSAYSLGIGIPLFILSFGFNSILATYKKLVPYMKYINIISGIFMIFLGVLITSNSFTLLTSLLTRYHIGWNPGK